jgi:PTS system mannose-specific IIB component
MPVVLTRVDNRLVHGQVLEGWVPKLRANTILVVDRELAGNPLRKSLIEGLSHPGLEVRLMDPERAVRFLAAEETARRVIVVFADTQKAVEAHEAGVRFGRLNLGNIHPREGSQAVTASVNLTVGDAKRLSDLHAQGVTLEAKAVPADRSPDLTELIHRES